MITEVRYRETVRSHDELEFWDRSPRLEQVARSVDVGAQWAAETLTKRGHLVSVLEPGDMTGYKYVLVFDRESVPFLGEHPLETKVLYGTLLNCGGAGGGVIPNWFMHPDYFESHFMGPRANVHTVHVMARFFDLVNALTYRGQS